ncbi:nucleoside-diphosphate sugar epimerase/dehydratase [Pullulanibacillus sp. KACC 23026]|uniref:polysaccharide biosynthesis protein n=1 Tax=Pullulanibacillus sp. KACC 23026 TaxID=3028315 RepID=UPI0023B1DD19|nr:nucleoside-diphosphate sugar epimerase/dehydratase [Pullulanibacillus sp. KACC 23026]WEG11522.1 nucleoside-diphosphate sugar epimerase/dehydratase [Pullulanibacillus sp. KACC 23026]
MTYAKRLTVFVLVDSLIAISSVLSGLTIIQFHPVYSETMLFSTVCLLICHYFFSSIYKLYKKAWEYASVHELIMIIKTVTFSVLLVGGFQFILFKKVDVRFLVVTGLLYLFLISGSRLMWRLIRDTYIIKWEPNKRTLIIGAGSAGIMVARQLLTNKNAELCPFGFIDDSPSKQGLDILGMPVLGGVGDIENIVEDNQITNIVIAIPSLSKKDLNRIFVECSKTNAKTQTIPMLEDLMTGKVSVSEFRDVQVEDLLGRKPVSLDIASISEFIKNNTILVTGAGGSIGSEICRQIIPFQPSKLILLGHGENSIYSINNELKEWAMKQDIELIPVIADVQDFERIQKVIQTYRPSVVYHAAAHKHVPLMEENPEEAIKNNLIGTKNMAEACHSQGVETFVMVSSDKAVNPTSVMGATKRLAEMIIQHMDSISLTRFVAVRFGNVLGSRGSVIPLFKKQIQSGGPVTVTHPEMQRYFMTIPEASRLVLQAGVLAKGGEIFVLDMGEPVKIVDLAENLIRLSGHTIEEIGLTFTGVRPGEKLSEELLNLNERHEEQVYPHIYIGKTSQILIQEINELLNQFLTLSSDEIKKRVVEMANRNSFSEKLLSVSS